ncbi:MAG: efflux RND transporter permease subunit [Candidatus Marinimicrobia bacterium]|nr:efflux RND transporter permease subunit [Candidatus Neomarinimicrobiota bacterium]MCF7827650.1 efflux RND transporter permease subunit [Candidatus Neomarinimicrobiota bacterium]MCF7881295.1 efflux RND transporter permease subunit [Candidatus Neomarinimicrobiota bacterium]
MIERIIEWSINNRFLVIIATLFLIGAGYIAVTNTPLDAIPDLSDVQVIIKTDYPGQAPQVVEDQVTYPITTAMMSVPYSKTVRGYSMFGTSFVYIIFEDGTDMYWARSRVLEYLSSLSDRLPDGVTPQLGPDATGVGWVYEYSVESEQHSLAELRSIQDWFLRYELLSVDGVAEVASVGGFVKQYQVEVDPNKLAAFNIPLRHVKMQIKQSNQDVGGRVLEMGETEYMVRGLGYIKSIEDIEKIPLGVDESGTPILLKQVANVHTGPELRRGIAERDGEGEVVGGIIVMRYGENALKVIEDVKEKLAELRPGLPEGVEIRPMYDRSSLILEAVENLYHKLGEEMLVVSLIIIGFLLHLRSSFVIVVTLPLGILASFIVMYYQGINANIMSLGGIAIAIGAMVDAAVVMIENAHKHLEREQPEDNAERWQLILRASKEVGPALFYSLLIITVSFIPVFSLEAQEGRLFKPLAFTKTYAMAASAILAVTLVPVLMGFFIRGKIRTEEKHPVSRALHWMYEPLLRVVLRFRKTTVAIAAILLLVTAYPVSQIGSEFMPPINEGDLLYMPTTPPGISVTKAKELLQQTDKIIKSFPEVETVFGKIGRAETATDPAPLTMIETTIMLKDKEHWRPGVTMDDLIQQLDDAIQFPGVTNAWTMPIKTRIDMLATGIKTPVGIKLMGENLQTLSDIGEEIEGILQDVPGTASVYSERVTGGNFIDFEINRDEAARYGLTVGDVQDVIKSAIGGMNVGNTVEGLERYPINVRYGRELRDNLTKLRRTLVPTPTGAQIPISQVAEIKVKKGAPMIKSENARRTAWIYVDLNTSDIGGYVQKARQVVNENVQFPEGYSLVWSGQYESMQRVKKRLQVVVPVTLVLIFLLLYIHFKNITESILVMISLPLATVGGFWLMWLLGYNFSIAVGVGFIALSGVAAELGVVILVYMNNALKEKPMYEGAYKPSDVFDAVIDGAVQRLRPVIMTVATTILGLVPIMYGAGTGSQVMKRIVAPMVGGLFTATVLTLLVMPTIFYLWKRNTVVNLALEEE